MKNAVKFLSVLFVFCLVLGLTACGNQEADHDFVTYQMKSDSTSDTIKLATKATTFSVLPKQLFLTRPI